MKFLCGNCKSKYHIDDGKIAGRTLRMKCRRCSHDIIIRGEGGNSESPASAPQSRAAHRAESSSQGSLGADFRKQAGSTSVPPPAPKAPVDQWHVSINDVPVGPVRKAEIARKISAGAVNSESLCWREGFDDWRPVREVPELSGLLRAPAPPPPARAAAVGRGISRHASRPRIRPVSGRVGASARPAARSNVQPIGGRLGASAAPQLAPDPEAHDQTLSDPLFLADAIEAAPAAVPTPAHAFGSAAASTSASGHPAPFDAAPAADVGYSDPPPRRKAVSPFVWIAAAGAIAFGTTLAVFIGIKFLSEPPTEVATNITEAETSNPAGPGDLVIPEAGEIETQETPENGEIEEAGEEAEVDANPRNPGVARAGTQTGTQTPDMATGSNLTAEQRRLLEEMGGGTTDPDLGNIRQGSQNTDGPAAEQLDAAALTAVVGRNRPSLQRCYETAIRGMGAPPTVRLNVTVTIAGSGRVTNVSTSGGSSINGLASCAQGAVGRWVFPRSGGTSRTTFPIVFQGG